MPSGQAGIAKASRDHSSAGAHTSQGHAGDSGTRHQRRRHGHLHPREHGLQARGRQGAEESDGRRAAAKPLPAVSLLYKDGVLGGLAICRMLPLCDSGSAGKNRAPASRPQFYAFATCCFVDKNRVVLGDCLFFPTLPKYGHYGSELRCPRAPCLCRRAKSDWLTGELRLP